MVYLVPLNLFVHIELMDVGASQLCMNTLTHAHFTLWETLFGNGGLISGEPSL